LYIPIETGEPKGSVLGHSLFLYYTNDIRLFTDDTIAYMGIKFALDAQHLQKKKI